MDPDTPPRGRPLRLDPNAEIARPDVPAFLARPPGSSVYHGFPVLDDVEVEGFRFGMISDFEAKPGMGAGDAFVVAPDGSRAGLVWEVSDVSYVEAVCPIERDRWGVWAVAFPYPMRSRVDVRRNLQAVLPDLKDKWETWRSQFSASSEG